MKTIFSWIDSLNTFYTSCIIYSTILIGSIFLIIWYINNVEEYEKTIINANTPISNSLGGSTMNYILYVCAGYTAIGFSMLIELFIDFRVDYSLFMINDRMERFSTSVVLFVPSIFLIHYRHSDYFITLFPLCMTIKLFQCYCSVLAICNRLYPKTFTNTISIFCSLSFTSCGVLTIVGLQEKMNIYHIMSSILGAGAIFVYLLTTFHWIAQEKILHNYKLFKLHELTPQETYVLAYVSSMMFPVVLVFSAGLGTALRWTRLSSNDALIYVYSYGIYALVINSVPGRVAKSSAMRFQNEIINSKRRLIRYICHEIRSPVNIIKSNLDFILEDISTKFPDEGTIINEIVEMSHACDSAVNVLDDILQLESLEADRFKLEFSYLPLANTFEQQLASQGKLYARQKGIELEVVNSIEKSILESSYLFGDSSKLQQVMQNLVANAVKFTPFGGKITIKLSDYKSHQDDTPGWIHEIYDEESVVSSKSSYFDLEDGRVYKQFLCRGNNTLHKDSLPPTKFHENVVWKSSNHVSNNDKDMHSSLTTSRNNCMTMPVTEELLQYIYHTDIIIEVIDSGVGIRSDFLQKLFGEFAQFKPLELQGGGGSGLGLWICKEIVLRHKGSIGCYSTGEGHGAKFMVVLPVYRKVNMDETVPTYVESINHPNTVTDDRVVNNNNEEEHLGLELKELHNNEAMIFPGIYNTKDTELMEHVVNNPNYNNDLRGNDLRRNEILPVKKILIVDDSALNRKVLIKIIQRHYNNLKQGNGDQNHFTIRHTLQCDECEDGKDAIERIKEAMASQDEYSLVFIDNIMIDVHGPEAATQMRKLQFIRPIVGVTGNAMAHDVDLFIRAGANEVLKKPVKKEEIERWINFVLHTEE